MPICSEACRKKNKVDMNVQRLGSEDFLPITSPRVPGNPLTVRSVFKTYDCFKNF